MLSFRFSSSIISVPVSSATPFVYSNEMISELSFDWCGYRFEGRTPNCFLKFTDHVALPEPTKVTAPLRRRAGGFLSRKFLKILEFSNLFRNLNSLGFGRHQPVRSVCAWFYHTLPTRTAFLNSTLMQRRAIQGVECRSHRR